MSTIEEYMHKGEYASRALLDAIWKDHADAEKLRAEIDKESKIVAAEYQQAIAIQMYAEDADDVMLGAGRYWENYFGADKEIDQKKVSFKNLKKS